MAYRIQARIGVQAPAFAVWDVMSQFETWKDWNPVITEVEGRLSIGALLRLRRVRIDGKGEIEEVRVVDWVPHEQILWTRSVAPFARALAFLEIEALSPTACILSVGEIYDGLIGERLGERARRPLTERWRTLADALKGRAEDQWDGTPGEPPAPPPTPHIAKAKKGMQLEQIGFLGRRKPM